MSCACGSPCLAARAYHSSAIGAVGRAVLAVEVEVAQQALAQRIAGLGGQRQPFAREIRVALDAPGR